MLWGCIRKLTASRVALGLPRTHALVHFAMHCVHAQTRVVHTYTHAHTNIHKHGWCTHTHTHTHTQTRAVHTYTHTCKQTQTRVVHTYTHTHTQTNTNAGGAWQTPVNAHSLSRSLDTISNCAKMTGAQYPKLCAHTCTHAIST